MWRSIPEISTKKNARKISKEKKKESQYIDWKLHLEYKNM